MLAVANWDAIALRFSPRSSMSASPGYRLRVFEEIGTTCTLFIVRFDALLEMMIAGRVF
jgi:hypothetical protein